MFSYIVKLFISTASFKRYYLNLVEMDMEHRVIYSVK